MCFVPPTNNTITHIVKTIPQIKVIWINADTIIAFVQNVMLFKIAPIQKPRDPMSKFHFASYF